MEVLNAILEIIKYIVPALVIYFLMNRFITGQQNIEQIKIKATQRNDTLPLRFQAYERLALFLERIKIPSLVLRLKANNAPPEDLKNAIVISVQKEFEHNLTQQIYISSELWKIIELAKDSTIAYTTELYDKQKTNTEAYIDILVQGNQKHLSPILKNAQAAIKKEVELYFR
jgi:hypothetical protein